MFRRLFCVSDTSYPSQASSTSVADYHPSMADIWLAPIEDKTPSMVSPDVVPERDPNDARHTLVLDLDETLVSSTWHYPYGNFTFLRPYVIPFLREMHELFEVIYWTSASESYGRAVLEVIETTGKRIDGKSVCGENPPALFRQHCGSFWDPVQLKYLPQLKRPVQNVLIIDDRPSNFWLTPRQAIWRWTSGALTTTRRWMISPRFTRMVSHRESSLVAQPGIGFLSDARRRFPR